MTRHLPRSIAGFGLGYVGLPLAVEVGKQRPVIGFAINTSRTPALPRGRHRPFVSLARTTMSSTI
jgi:UDP-N-acetyl-D-mannosaminuronate dehydrogenase